MNRVTADFVSAMSKPEDRVGTFARDIAQGKLPEGVDPNEPAVKMIVEECKDYYEKRKAELF